MRAPLKLSVIAPRSDWHVIGNGKEFKKSLDCASKEGESLLKSQGFNDLLQALEISPEGYLWDFEASPS